MPHINLTIADVDQAVTRPVILSIVRQIQEITKIDKGIQILFPGDILTNQTPGGNIDSQNERLARFDQNRFAFIEVEESYNVDALATTAVMRKEHIPVFVDSRLGVEVTPIYSTTDININFKYRSISKTEVMRWRDDIRVKVSQYRDINIHDVEYHYPIPNAILTVIQEIHDKREEVAGYGQNIQEYIFGCATDRLKVIGDLVGKSARLAVAEKQCRIQGFFGFDALPEKPERDDSNGTWSITFSYRFSFEKPIACRMSYPVMVHNQLLEKEFVEFANKAPDLDMVSKSFPLSLHAFNAFETTTTMNARRKPNLIIRIPDFDDYLIPDVLRGTGTILMALCEVDAADKRTLLNLNELGDIVLDQDILDFIKASETPYLNKLYNSIFNLSLYRNNFLASHDSLICDANLNVRSTRDLDLRIQHRIRLSITVDLAMLQGKAIARLREHPKALVKVIGSMNELLWNNPDFVKLGDETYISEYHFSELYGMVTGHPYKSDNFRSIPDFRPGSKLDKIYQTLDKKKLEDYRKNRVNRNTVLTAAVIAHRKDQ